MNLFRYILLYLILLTTIFAADRNVLTNPNGGEKLETNSVFEITWKINKIQGEYVFLYFSEDLGATWEEITFTQNDGEYKWKVPNILSSKCLVKIVDYSNTSNQYISSGNFSIFGKAIKIISPNGGEIIKSGRKHLIKWESNDLNSNSVRIYLSLDNGEKWDILNNNTNNSGEYYWEVESTNQDLSTCLVKITDYIETNISDESNAKFSIMAEGQELNIISPQPGDILPANKNYDILWNSFNLKSRYLRLYYSTNNGFTWEKITSHAENNGVYGWKTPKKSSSQYLLKIEETGRGGISTKIAETFIITDEPNIKITQPSLGEKLSPGIDIDIQWKSINLQKSKLNLYYSIDNGMNWEPITYGIKNTGVYSWRIPELQETKRTCKIKIQAVENSKIIEICDYNYTILGVPSLQLTFPNGGEVLYSDLDYKIYWKNQNINSQNIDLQYSIDGDNWYEIVNNETNLGMFLWKPPNKISETCLIRVGNINAYDLSDNYFTISNVPEIGIIKPFNNDHWKAGKEYIVQWYSHNLADDNITIEISVDNGMIWKNIATNIANSSEYKIKLPMFKKSYENCKIKISSFNRPEIFNILSGVISISGIPFISSVDINKQEVYYSGNQLIINWFAQNIVSENVDIGYTFDNGLNWHTIAEHVTNDSIFWEIPKLVDRVENCYVEVYCSNNRAISKLSNSFSIEPALQEIHLLSLIDNQFYMGDTIDMSWESIGLQNSNINLYYSTNNGVNWHEIAIQELDDGKYSWIIPNKKLSSNQCLIKVESESNYEINSVTKSPFIILHAPKLKKLSSLKTNYTSGENLSFTWQSENVEMVKLYYSIEDEQWIEISEEIENQNKFEWRNPKVPKLPIEFRIKVVDLTQRASSISDIIVISEIIEIAKKKKIETTYPIEIYIPTGGEKWTEKKANMIRWESSQAKSKKVNLYVSFDNGKSWKMQASNIPNNGLFMWQLPEVQDKQNRCKIKIESSNNSNIIGISRGNFTINN